MLQIVIQPELAQINYMPKTATNCRGNGHCLALVSKLSGMHTSGVRRQQKPHNRLIVLSPHFSMTIWPYRCTILLLVILCLDFYWMQEPYKNHPTGLVYRVPSCIFATWKKCMLRVCEGNIFLEACRMIGLLYIGFANKAFQERLSQKHVYAYVPKCCIVGYCTTSPIVL